MAAPNSLLLEYAGNDKLYVPVSQLHLISRYTGAAQDDAPLHKLGSGHWDKGQAQGGGADSRHRRRITQSLRQRAARGHQFQLNQHRLRGVCRQLWFEETRDQQAAISR